MGSVVVNLTTGRVSERYTSGLTDFVWYIPFSTTELQHSRLRTGRYDHLQLVPSPATPLGRQTIRASRLRGLEHSRGDSFSPRSVHSLHRFDHTVPEERRQHQRMPAIVHKSSITEIYLGYQLYFYRRNLHWLTGRIYEKRMLRLSWC